MADQNDQHRPDPFGLRMLVSDLEGFMREDLSFLLEQREPDGRRKRVVGLEWEDVTEAPQTIPPTFRLSRDAAQYLVDRLYALGFRPRDAAYFNPALQATQSHLEDMRAIAFAKTGVTPPAGGRRQ